MPPPPPSLLLPNPIEDVDVGNNGPRRLDSRLDMFTRVVRVGFDQACEKGGKNSTKLKNKSVKVTSAVFF